MKPTERAKALIVQQRLRPQKKNMPSVRALGQELGVSIRLAQPDDLLDPVTGLKFKGGAGYHSRLEFKGFFINEEPFPTEVIKTMKYDPEAVQNDLSIIKDLARKRTQFLAVPKVIQELPDGFVMSFEHGTGMLDLIDEHMTMWSRISESGGRPLKKFNQPFERFVKALKEYHVQGLYKGGYTGTADESTDIHPGNMIDTGQRVVFLDHSSARKSSSSLNFWSDLTNIVHRMTYGMPDKQKRTRSEKLVGQYVDHGTRPLDLAVLERMKVWENVSPEFVARKMAQVRRRLGSRASQAQAELSKARRAVRRQKTIERRIMRKH